MLSVSLRLLVFAVASFLMLELSLRVYYFGADAFSPTKMNSHTVIMDSPLVQRAADADVYYELKPNLDSLHAGQPLQTNSAGLPDKEYSLSKPDNTYRIAVVGSSWSMATGVAPMENYAALLEEELQGTLADRNVEVINFAVEFYGLSEITATVRNKVLDYDPDMLLIAVTSMTPLVRWQDDKPAFTQIEITPPFWQSILYSTVMGKLGRQPYAKTTRPLVNPVRGDYALNIDRSMEEIAGMLEGKDIDAAVLWLTYARQDDKSMKQGRKKVESRGFSFVPLDMQTLATEAGTTEDPMVGRIGRHPSKVGHRLIADKIIATLWGQS